MKYQVVLYLLVSLLSILITVSSCKTGEAITIFPDTNLERAIGWAVNQPEGDISQERLENLVKLDLSKLLIHDLTGLEYCINLEDLNLDTNEITDISPLSSLKKLETLDLTSNPILDLSPLSECTRLKKLVIINVSISDLTPLSNLILLQSLILNQFEFDRGLSFNRMHQIQEGDYVDFVDISPIANLINLRELSLKFYFIKDISVLSALYKLESLSLSCN